MELERAAAKHWRGTEEEWLGDWLLRAAEGFTGRANSALPLGGPGIALDDALRAVTGWYRARGLPAMISVPMPLAGGSALDEALAGRGWGLRPGPAFVMTAALSRPPAAPDGPGSNGAAPSVSVAAAPDDEWLRMHRYRGQSDLPPVRMSVLTSAPAQAFISLRDGATAVAVARLSLAGGWAGITSVEVDPARRRRGLGTAITSACCDEAFRRGATRVFLQVETGNEAARALYERCGFSYSHRYHYRVAPARLPAGTGAAGDTPGQRGVSGEARYSLRLSSWLPVRPGARLAREAGHQALSLTPTSTMSTTTTNRRT